MAAETTNYGLTKPTANESYDITVFNQNADLIDAALKELEESKACHIAEKPEEIFLFAMEKED